MTDHDHITGNVAGWQQAAVEYIEAGRQAWQSATPFWGIWQLPEAEIQLLPADMTGLDCIELGCGTAYGSAWMHRRGGNVVGIDPTPAQLKTATQLRSEFGDNIQLLRASAESVPLADNSFDFAFSEYGAALWADPYQWIPEAARLLRPSGKLVFLTNSVFTTICVPDYERDGPTQEKLLRPYLGMYKIIWPDEPDMTEFQLPHGKWIELFRENGFKVDKLLELAAPRGGKTRYSFADAAWAQCWPSEDVWMLSKE